MQNRNLTAQNEKNSACDFFSHSWNFDAISCKKMREYREIAPENDPCKLVFFSYFSQKTGFDISLGDNLHAISKPIFWEYKYRNNSYNWDRLYWAVSTQIRRCILQYLIWVCTVCCLPSKILNTSADCGTDLSLNFWNMVRSWQVLILRVNLVNMSKCLLIFLSNKEGNIFVDNGSIFI